MSVAQFLAALAKAPGPRGGYLEIVDGDGINYVGPKAILTDEVRAFVRAHRDEIVAWLRSPVTDEDALLFDCRPLREPVGEEWPFPWPPPEAASPSGATRADRQQTLFTVGESETGGTRHE